MTTGTKTSFTRALAKAASLGGFKLVRRELGNGRYIVQGSREYTVLVDHTGYSCTCKAGQAELPCYHGAAVAHLIAAQRAMPNAQPNAHNARWTEGEAPGASTIFAEMGV